MEEKKIKYKLKHLILYSPFEQRPDRCWPYDDQFKENKALFCEKCYSDPCFDEKEKTLLKELEEENLSKREEEALKTQIEFLREKKFQKNEFEESLDISIENPIYIRGFSGSGKSTYVNTLLYKKYHENPNVICEIFDLASSLEKVYIFKKTWENKNYAQTMYKMVSVLLSKIAQYLEYKENDDKDAYKEKLRVLLTNYENIIFPVDNSAKKVFRVIKEFLENKINYKNESLYEDNEDTYCDKMYNAILDYCGIDDETVWVNTTVTRLLELLVTILLCSKPSPKDYKYIMFFDNIEYFIKKDEVYNEDINKIAKGMHELVRNLTESLKRVDIHFSKQFKIIIAIRDTTEKMIEEVYLHDEDKKLVQIDVSSWFTMDEILDRKIKFFETEGICSEDLKNEVMYELFHDSTYVKSGLRNTLSKMYNHNKRRLTNYVTDELIKRPEFGKDYLAIWKRALDFEQRYRKTEAKIHKELSDTYKFASRQLILRMLLDSIEACKYFEEISTVRGNNEVGLGYARRIMTYLYRWVPIDDMENDIAELGYVGFNTLIRNILHSPLTSMHDTDVTQDKVKILAEILCKMHSSSIVGTNWCQLVLIKFNQTKFDKDALRKKMWECYQDDYDDENYGVKITEAGRYFVESILPIFEYFSCRYFKNSAPLFALENLKLVDNGKANKGILLMQRVMQQTFKCIERVIAQDMRLFKKNGNACFNLMYSTPESQRKYCYEPATRCPTDYGHEQCHVLRILHSHISYFDNYRVFVLTATNENGSNYYDDDVKIMLSTAILKIINKYLEKLSQIIENRIGEKGTEIQGDSYVGNMNVFWEKERLSKYIENFNSAEKEPLDYSIRIRNN